MGRLPKASDITKLIGVSNRAADKVKREIALGISGILMLRTDCLLRSANEGAISYLVSGCLQRHIEPNLRFLPVARKVRIGADNPNYRARHLFERKVERCAVPKPHKPEPNAASFHQAIRERNRESRIRQDTFQMDRFPFCRIVEIIGENCRNVFSRHSIRYARRVHWIDLIGDVSCHSSGNPATAYV